MYRSEVLLKVFLKNVGRLPVFPFQKILILALLKGIVLFGLTFFIVKPFLNIFIHILLFAGLPTWILQKLTPLTKH